MVTASPVTIDDCSTKLDSLKLNLLTTGWGKRREEDEIGGGGPLYNSGLTSQPVVASQSPGQRMIIDHKFDINHGYMGERDR